MKTTVVLLAGGVHASQPSFEEWQGQYGINSADDEMRAAYQSNVNLVDMFNAEDSGATFAVNQFSGMRFEEFQSKVLNYKPRNVSAFPTLEVSTELASSVDWVQQGVVTPVKDQGQCGSCWTFGTNGAIESIFKQQTGRSVNLAEQQLVDCTYPNYDGCNGGNDEDAFDYLSRHSACTTSSYSYHARSGTCKTGSCTPAGVALSGYNYVSASESALTSALQHSVVAVYVEATNRFSNYRSGVLNDSSNHRSTDHAVLAVGYASSYFKIKNSWSTSWGERGYIRISRNAGWSHGAFAVVADKPMVPKVSSAGPSPSPSPSPSPDGRRRRRRRRRSGSMDEIEDENEDEHEDEIDADVVV